jgi:flagellar assembly protein FliH
MAIKNVPPPPGSKPASLYQRFIPREELGDFASWRPGTFGDAPAGASAGHGAGNLAGNQAGNQAGHQANAHAGAQSGAQSSAHSGARPASAAAQAATLEPSQADWLAKVAAARQTGYQEGYRDGLVALESFKQGFAQQTTAQVGQLLQAFDEQLNVLDGDIAAALAQTAVQLARQVLRAELMARPELVAQVASEAVGAVMLSARHINVQVHPLDLPLVAQGAEETLAARGARLSANAQVARGGVLVHSDVGNIDARIGTRWSQAAAALGSVLPLQDDLDDELMASDMASNAVQAI